MNKKLLILLCVCSFHVFIAQVKDDSKKLSNILMSHGFIGNDESKELFDSGNIAFAKLDYEKADSLFSLSLKLMPHPDTYYNRAVCRRKMNNFSGYCVDLGGASNMGDKEAYRLYCIECAKIDTLFTKNTNEPATRKSFEFVTFTTNYKYNTNGDYEKYDRAGNMLLSYIIMGSDTIYLKSNEVKSAAYSGGNIAIEEFIKTKTSFYSNINKNKMRGKVNLALTIGTNGRIKRVKVLLGLRDGSSDSLARALYALAPYEPAKYNGKDVKYQSHISVTFENNSLAVSEIRPYYKIFNVIYALPDSTKEVVTTVEEMPEFPGGPMEMLKFIHSKLKMPKIAKEAGLTGKCFLKFVVGADGLIYNVEILKGVPGCSECDAEALKAVSSMPRWKPGKQNGKAVSCFFNLPINFQSR